MVAPLIARAAAQAAKGAAKKQVAKGAAKANAAKSVAKKAARVKNNPAEVAARSKYRKRIKRRISNLEKQTKSGLLSPIEKSRADYMVDYLQKRLQGSYANKLGKYADALDELRNLSENVMSGDSVTRNARMDRAILNSPIGSRIYGGLEKIWNVEGVNTKNPAEINRAIMQYFGVDSMNKVMRIVEIEIPNVYEPAENEQIVYDEVKESIAKWAKDYAGIPVELAAKWAKELENVTIYDEKHDKIYYPDGTSDYGYGMI